jgi:hypothetical protein
MLFVDVAESSRWVYFSILILIIGRLGFADDPKTTSENISIDRQGEAESCEAWNRAVRAARGKRWDELTTMLAPAERALWSTDAQPGVSNSIAAFYEQLSFPYEIDPQHIRVKCYRHKDGQMFSRIYGEQSRKYQFPGGPAGVRRFVLGTFSGDADSPRYLQLGETDKCKFGLGESVAGIRLEARVEHEMVDSWDDVLLSLKLVNTSRSNQIGLQARPSLYLNQNVAIGIVSADTPNSHDAFVKWYNMNELTATARTPVLPLFNLASQEHKLRYLEPRQGQELRTSLGKLFRRENDMSRGPSGSFKLFVVYDPNLESDPFEAALPSWQHRIASAPFTVTVARKADPDR